MGSVLTNEKRWKNELFLEELQTEKEEDGSIKYFTNRKTIINLMSKYSLNSTDEYDYKYRMLKIDLDNWFYSYGGEMGFVEKDVLRISKELDRDEEEK
tara:strand:- start:246 stop:539 length:294 start_codon:yes stop_codon:yes gene_type:complete